METDELWTVREVAKRLKVHPETVRRWIRTGKINAVSLGSARAGLRVHAGEISQFLARGYDR